MTLLHILVLTVVTGSATVLAGVIIPVVLLQLLLHCAFFAPEHTPLTVDDLSELQQLLHRAFPEPVVTRTVSGVFPALREDATWVGETAHLACGLAQGDRGRF